MAKASLPLFFENLMNTAKKWKETLEEYQYLSGISDHRIKVLYNGFLKRIQLLKSVLTKRISEIITIS